MIEHVEPDVILLDIYLTTHDGLDILQDIQKKYFHIPVVMITGYSDVQIAVKQWRLARSIPLKPIDLEQLRTVLQKCETQLQMKNEILTLKSLVQGEELTKEHFGKSKLIQRTINTIEGSLSAVTLPYCSRVKAEPVKKLLQDISIKKPRKNNVFIPINCAAIPKELAESELFGHEKGAFTGAAQRTKPGKFELADKGTILLDEIVNWVWICK